ncbi:MAG TPA: T9SS type A sorting domain-containing protein, partial [Bacteroidia bacterium]|nr:T9SS type A sorting domain-containing protein [Bacteroidia bacterium]
IIGWYKYTSASGDNADIEFYLFGSSNSDTVGEAFYKTPTSTVGAYTRFSLPLTYRSSHAVMTALWIVTSSDNQNSGKVGSQLYVGELGLIFDSATGINNIINPEMIRVGPNPSTGLISIKNISNSKSLLFSLVDITGRKVQEEKIGSGTTSIQLNETSMGSYIYFLQDEQNNVIKTGKIIVQ